MFLLYLLFLFIKIKSSENKSNEPDISFNNDFNYIFNDTGKKLLFYLGSEILTTKIENNTFKYPTVNYYDNYININYTNNNNITFIIDDKTKISYKGNNTILVVFNDTNQVKFQFLKYSDYSKNSNCIIDNNNCTLYKFYSSENSENALFNSNGENIFIKINYFSYALIFFGLFSILFGAYHYMISLIIHLALFIYFFIYELITINIGEIDEKIIYLFIFLCFIFSISLSVLLNTKKKNNKKYFTLKVFHGCSFGYFTYKTLIYYYIFFDGTLVDDTKTRVLIYFAISTVFIFIGFALNLFNPFRQYIFLPSSTVSGSYEIIKGIGYIIGGYFSDIIAIKEKLNFNYVPNINEYKWTYLIIHILLIIFSILYQINYIKNKQDEIEKLNYIEEPNEIPRTSNLSNTSNSIKKDESQELIDKTQNENNDEEDDINDQED